MTADEANVAQSYAGTPKSSFVNEVAQCCCSQYPSNYTCATSTRPSDMTIPRMVLVRSQRHVTASPGILTPVAHQSAVHINLAALPSPPPDDSPNNDFHLGQNFHSLSL